MLPCINKILQKSHIEGTIAQMVEQRTENPCVPGSIPGGTTQTGKHSGIASCFLFYFSASFLNHFFCLQYRVELFTFENIFKQENFYVKQFTYEKADIHLDC